jgi:hypothetical protein
MFHEDFSVIFSGNIVQADLLKCVLEGEGIHAILGDEFAGMIAPYATSPAGLGAVKVLIPHSDVHKARKIVEDFLKINHLKLL